MDHGLFGPRGPRRDSLVGGGAGGGGGATSEATPLQWVVRGDVTIPVTVHVELPAAIDTETGSSAQRALVDRAITYLRSALGVGDGPRSDVNEKGVHDVFVDYEHAEVDPDELILHFSDDAI